MRRHENSDGRWDRIKGLLPGWAGDPGVTAKGVCERVYLALQDADVKWLLLDITVIRAHQHAAGAKKGA